MYQNPGVPQQQSGTGWGSGATLVLAGTYKPELELLLLSPADARRGAAQMLLLGRLRLDALCRGMDAGFSLAGGGAAAAAAAAAATPVAESALLLPGSDGGDTAECSRSGEMQVRRVLPGGAAQARPRSRVIWGPATGHVEDLLLALTELTPRHSAHARKPCFLFDFAYKPDILSDVFAALRQGVQGPAPCLQEANGRL